jgi:acetolactate synthase-1/2/3 large subunit
MGDGAFVWGCPVATLWPAGTYHAPFLSVIFNNQAYAAIKGLVQRAYGTDKLPAKIGLETGVDITPPPDYAAVARGCGAFGKTVEDPAEIVPALKEGLNQVRSGKAAVVDVKLV